MKKKSKKTTKKTTKKTSRQISKPIKLSQNCSTAEMLSKMEARFNHKIEASIHEIRVDVHKSLADLHKAISEFYLIVGHMDEQIKPSYIPKDES